MPNSSRAKPNVVDSFSNLRDRVERLLRPSAHQVDREYQLGFQFSGNMKEADDWGSPKRSISDFLDFISHVNAVGGVYIFGGLLRDLAIFGKKGFGSDVDVVVEGDWESCEDYLEGVGAVRNKFGGFRLVVSGVPVDIWNAQETWAIRRGLVEYQSVASLVNTTVLNWDAILMNWTTKNFICSDNYLDQINERLLDVVLEDNPNPIGMAVRVFRHLCSKDARRISINAADYLTHCASLFSFEEIRAAEIKSYRNSLIEPTVYCFFERMSSLGGDPAERVSAAAESMKRDGMRLPFRQGSLDFS